MHREKSQAHSLAHCSLPFSDVICTDRKPGGCYANTSRHRSRCSNMSLNYPFKSFHSRLNAHYSSLEVANERSMCKMFAFTIVEKRYRDIQQRLLTITYFDIKHVYFLNNKLSLYFLCAFHLHFAMLDSFCDATKTYRIGLLF